MSARKRTRLSPQEDDEESTSLVVPQGQKPAEKKPELKETLIEITDTDSEEEIEEERKPSLLEEKKPKVEDQEDQEDTEEECEDDPDEKEEMPFMPLTSAEASERE